MKIIVSIHGKPKDKRILELLEEYKIKISRYQKINFDFIPLSRPGDKDVLINVLERYKGNKIYILDEDGKEYTTTKFAENYEKDLNNGDKGVVFVIGPAEGFGSIPPGKSGGAKEYEIISLSKMAMQHDIASLVLIEQIYRVVSIKNNLPYHRV